MSVKEAARMLGVSRPYIYELEKRGELRINRNVAYRSKGPTTIPIEDVRRILAKRQS